MRVFFFNIKQYGNDCARFLCSDLSTSPNCFKLLQAGLLRDNDAFYAVPHPSESRWTSILQSLAPTLSLSLSLTLAAMTSATLCTFPSFKPATEILPVSSMKRAPFSLQRMHWSFVRPV